MGPPSIRSLSTAAAAAAPASKSHFKPILSNPLLVPWPALTPKLEKLILESLIQLFSPSSTSSDPATCTDLSIAEWRVSEHARKRTAEYRRTKVREPVGGSQKLKKGKERRSVQGDVLGVAPGGTSTQESTLKEISHLPKRPLAGAVEEGSSKKRKTSTSAPAASSSSSLPSVLPSPSTSHPVSDLASASTHVKPPLLDHLTVGINQITRELERRIRIGRRELGDSTAFPDGERAVTEGKKRISARSRNRGKGRSKLDPEGSLIPTAAPSAPAIISTLASVTPVELVPATIAPSPSVDIIFVCKADINPPSLVAHLPTMVAVMNGILHAQEQPRRVLLMALDEGAEKRLADGLRLRRVAAIGISSSAPSIDPLLALLSAHLKPLTAPWLIPHLLHPSLPSRPPPSTASPASAITTSMKAPIARHLIPTHVKHLRTTMPLDPKAAHAMKKDARDARKRLRKVAKKGATSGMKTEKGAVYMAED